MNPDFLPSTPAEIRARAEAIMRAKTAPPSDDLSPEAHRVILHELRVHQIELEMQNEELRRTQLEVETLRVRYFDLYELAPAGYCTVSAKGLLVQSNLTAATLLGLKRDKINHPPISRFIHTESQDAFYLLRKTALDTGVPQQGELRMVKSDGTPFWGQLEFATKPAADGSRDLLIVFSDISVRKQQEAYKAMGAEVLRILNELGDRAQTIPRVVATLKAATGFDAVGMRLQDADGDFPYFTQQGFSERFLVTENSLVAKAPDGQPCRNPDGSVSLECTCGLVLSGKTDPANKLFTRGGSCWTNDTAPLLHLPAAEDPRLHPRNTCIRHGYASVALVPIRDGGRIIGLLQCNDRRQGLFTLEMVVSLEEIAANIGITLMRKQAEAALAESEQRFRTLFDRANDGIFLMAGDGRLMTVNQSFAAMHGYSMAEMAQMSLKDLATPANLHKAPELIARLLAGESMNIEVEHYHKDGHVVPIEVSASRVIINGQPLIQCFHRDITERRQRESIQTFLAQTSSGTATEPFFNALARFLAASLHMDFVCIDRLEGDGLNASTLAVWHDGKFEDNLTYALKDTPCGDVVGQAVCCFPASVCQFFPRDTVLRDLRAESYIGATLWSHTGRPIGLIAVIGRSPMVNRALAESTLKLVALRAAGELERLEAEDKVQGQLEELRRWQSVMLDREDRVMELKREVNDLCRKFGQEAPYASQSAPLPDAAALKPAPGETKP